MTTLLTKSIPNARPTDPALDFEVLRAEGIRHLENLATELWTDYNAHDPGITMLELFSYAITDLGYRTQMLPIQDLMAAPALAPKAWFEATEILPCEPVTWMDFRKSLIDVEGVRNAWLERADEAEVKILHLGIVFPSPSLSKDGTTIDVDLLATFLAEKKLPIPPNIETLRDEIQAHFDKKLKVKELQPYLARLKSTTRTRLQNSIVKTFIKKLNAQLEGAALSENSKAAVQLLGNISGANFTDKLPLPNSLQSKSDKVEAFFDQIKDLADFRDKAVQDSKSGQLGFDWTGLLKPPESPDFTLLGKKLNGTTTTTLEQGTLKALYKTELANITWEEVAKSQQLWEKLGIPFLKTAPNVLSSEANAVFDHKSTPPPVPAAFDKKVKEFSAFAKAFSGKADQTPYEDFIGTAFEKFKWGEFFKPGKGPLSQILKDSIWNKLNGNATSSESLLLEDAFEGDFNKINWDDVADGQQLWKALGIKYLKKPDEPVAGIHEDAKALFDFMENPPTSPGLENNRPAFFDFIAAFSGEADFKKKAVKDYNWESLLKQATLPVIAQIVKKLDGTATTEELKELNDQFVPAFKDITWDKVAAKQQIWADLNITNFTSPTPTGEFKLGDTAHDLFDFNIKYGLVKDFWPKIEATFVAVGANKAKSSMLDQLAHAYFLGDAFGSVEWVEPPPSAPIPVYGLLFTDKDGTKPSKTDYLELAKDILEYKPIDQTIDLKPVIQYFEDHFCDLGIHQLGHPGSAHPEKTPALQLNGIYRILLDLENHLDPENPAEVNPVIELALERLHAHRALCEDFLRPVVVQKRPVHICLHLEIDPNFDELEVAAQAVWNMQQYLSPAPRFRSFLEMRDLLKARDGGNSGENIFNGPLLDNGFLDDAELLATDRRTKYYHSDLVRIALATPGVIGVSSLKVNDRPESTDGELTVSSFYEVEVGDFVGIPSKPIIDVCKSCFKIKKGEIHFEMDGCDLHEKLDWFALLDAGNLPEERGGNKYPDGILRNDLTEYRGLQFDLPANYTVGDNHVSEKAPADRRAKARHLQAYLAFFDQILASYLGQLGQLRQLLVVDQDADAATRQLPPMFDLPGIRELIEENARFVAEPTDWILIIDDADDAAEDRDAMKVLLKKWMDGGAIAFPGFGKFRTALRQKLFRPTPANAAQAPTDLFETYGYLFENFFWKKYTSDPDNNHVAALRENAEDPSTRQSRKNAALDHLIARFGEQFSTYVATLLRPDAEPEDPEASGRQTFDVFLKKKADFLRDLARLGSERGKAYNYRQFDKLLDKAQVWNTPNISGLQRRVASLTGIELRDKNSSLIADPPYRLDLVQVSTKKGSGHWRILLRVRPESGFFQKENPDPALPIMVSPPFATKNAAQAALNKLAAHIWEADHETVKADGSKNWTATISIDGLLLLSGDEMSKDEARDHQNMVKELVKSAAHEIEGFHLVEHILLRPNDPKDHLLQLHLGCAPEETPPDPYSFWVSVVLPKNTARFGNPDFRRFFEQAFRRETPAHIAVRFCYLEKEDLFLFEEAFYRWMFEKAKCRPDDCNVTDAANALIDLLNRLDCSCACPGDDVEDGCCEKIVPVEKL